MKRFVLTLLIVLFAAAAVQARMVSIAGTRVNMRSGPGTRYPAQWELGSGFPLKVLGREGKWLRVIDFEGDSGWVFSRLTSKKPTVIVSKKLVNIRRGPGTKYRVVGTAAYGTVLKLLKRGKGWVRVQHSGNRIGWIRRTLVWGL